MKMKSWIVGCVQTIGVVSILFLFVVMSFAQLPTGTILGVVKDSSGAVVAGATVTITNTDTNLTRSIMTGDDGAYRAPALPVGNYAVQTMKEGFQTEERKGLVLTVGQEAVVDISLQLGSTAQTVTVTTEAAQVNTTTSTVGGLVSEQQVTDLPLNGRDYVNLTLLQPGITQTSADPRNIGSDGLTGVIFTSNGQPIWSNMFLLDGGIMLNMSGVNASSLLGTTLGIDGVKEYAVVTNTFSAEYGLVQGSQSAIVSKGGSNQFHGDAFEYLRNSSLDARNYFDVLDTTNVNKDGTNKSLPYPGKRIPPFRRNDFGGAFGGPIRKDKTFFWGVYEGVREALGTTNDKNTMPAACFVDGGGVVHATVPTTITNVNSFGTCASGEPAMISVAPVVQGLAGLYPYPDVTGRAFNYTFPYVQPGSENYGQLRVDENFSASDTGFIRLTRDISDETQKEWPVWFFSLHSAGEFATASENHIFSPTLLNSVSLSFSRTITNLFAHTNPEVAGPNVTLVTAANATCGPVGCVPGDFGSVAPGSGVGTFGGASAPGYLNQNIFTLGDNAYWTKGKHAFKFGTLINHYQQGVNTVFHDGGDLAFASLPNFFNGSYSSITTITPGSNTGRYFTTNTFGFYAQDDYRAFSRLTLNLGLRYEFETVPQDADPATRYSIKDVRTDKTGTPGAFYLNPSLHAFSPRVGFAWDITGKGTMSLRGGAGIFYDINNNGFYEVDQAQATPPISNISVLTNTAATPLIPLTVPLPLVSNNPPSPRVVDYNISLPTSLQYNLALSRSLPWDTALNIGYVGARGWHVPQLLEGNPQIPSGTAANGLPIYCSANALGECPGGLATVRVNPNFGQVSWQTAGGDSYYNSLQVTLNKRVSQGLQFQFAYTYSKLLNTGGNIAGTTGAQSIETPNDPDHIDRGPATFDARHNVRVSMVYHVPNIHSDSYVAKFEQGWWVSAIVAAQTGYPFSPTIGDRDLTNHYGMTFRPNIDASYNPATVVTGNPNQWFNPTMYDLQPAGTIGNAAEGSLIGPALADVDFSAVKDTKAAFLGEAGNIEFRAEMFNVLNHPNFSGPASSVWSGTANTTPAGQIGVTPGVTAVPSVGSITSTRGNSRQIQLALKVIF